MPLSNADIDFLREVVSRRSGNVLSARQGYLLESRLGPVAQRIGLNDVAALVAELRRSHESPLHQSVAEAMTINETSFFRDLQPFEALREEILPAVVHARSSSRQLWIWCAACSSGQEPYSVAMTIRQHFPALMGWRVRIVATDLSEDMLARTRAGIYSQFEVNRGLPSRMLVTYFTRQGTNWQVNEELRQLIDCRKVNLVGPWMFSERFDVVLMRNVLIYFDESTKQQILCRVAQVMQPDGYLLLGGGETLINLDVPFARDFASRAVYFRPVP